MADAEDLGNSEIEPVPVTPLSRDRPECSRTSILDMLKPPMKSDLARRGNTVQRETFEGENLREFCGLKPICESFLREIVSGCHMTSGSGYPTSLKRLHVLERHVK